MDRQAHPLTQLQAEIDAWAATHWDGAYWPPLANLARLTEELGEIARAVNQQHGEKRIKAGETPADLGVELADAVFAILCLANSTGVDLQQAWETMLVKYLPRED